MPFIRAEQKTRFKTYYYDESEKIEIRIDGSRAWRNNNPGNTKGIKGAIGRDQDGFDIFPDLAAGRKAKKDLILRKYKDYSSVRKMLKGKYDKGGNYIMGTAWSPAYDDNDPDLYADQIKEWSGLDVDNNKIKDLKPEEMEKLLDAMQRKEGFKKGTIEVIEPSEKKLSIPQGVVPQQPLPNSIRDRWPWDSNTHDDGLADRWKYMMP
jgi:hypothetical protein